MMKFTPKPHQNKAIDLVFNSEYGLNNFDRTQLIMACGTGKTFTSLQIAQKNIEKKQSSITIMLFPSLYLIDQTKKEWEQQTDIDNFKNPLVICSDDTIGKNEEDDIFEIEKSEVEYTVTTNYKKIKEYINKNRKTHQLIFSTYHSSHLLGKALLELNLKADLTLFDEAHKTAIINKENNSKSMGYALDDDKFPSIKRVFMTATVKHYVLKDDSEVEVFSMNNKELYGQISYEYSLREAINDKNISDYQIVGIVIDSEYIEKFRAIDELEKKNHRDEEYYNLKLEQKIVKIKAIEEAMRRYKIKTGLSFHRTIEESIYFSKNYKGSNIHIDHVDGTMNHKLRAEILKKLDRKDNYIVSNSRLLTEGVDLPDIGMVFLDKNMISKIDITQLVGRVQRVSKDNPHKLGYIVLPLFIDDISKLDLELSRNDELRTLFDIINNFRHIDTQLREEIAAKKSYTDDSSNWNENFEKVISFKSRFDKLPTLKSNNKEEIALAIWLNLQEKNIENNILSWNKIEKLHKLDSNRFTKRAKVQITNMSNLENDKLDEIEIFYEKLETVVLSRKIISSEDEYVKATKEFIENNGIEALKARTIYKGLSIGQYRSDKKKIFNKLECERLKEEMVLEYNHIHEEFLLSALEISKKNHFKATIDFIDKFGLEKINATVEHNGLKIGIYRNEWRKKYNKATDWEKKKLEDEFSVIHKDYLLSANFVYKRDHLNATVDFVKKYGYEKIVTKTVHNGFKIGQFRNEMRRKFKRAKSDEQQQLLEEFNSIDEYYLVDSAYKNFILNFKYTKEFVQKYGLKELTNLTEYKGYKIGEFRSRQKLKYKNLGNDTEKTEMKKKFDEIDEDILLDAIYVSKRDHINATLEFINEFGYKQLNHKTIYKDFKIGSFRANCREKYKKLSKKEKEDMKKEFDVISEDFLISKSRNKE